MRTKKLLVLGFIASLISTLTLYLVLSHPQPYLIEVIVYQELFKFKFLGPLWIITSAIYPILGILVLFLAWKFWQKNKKDELLFIILTTSGVFLAKLLKHFVKRPCPSDKILQAYPTASRILNQTLHRQVFPLKTSADYCWPSGHTLTYTTLLGGFLLLAYFNYLPTKTSIIILKWLSLFFLLAIGLSRIFLGQHWLLDVVGGYSLGIAWLTAVFLWFQKRKDEAKKNL